ncbi:MAG: dihydroneopterin aldolase [Proteobacteria bacterium]|nr:dihydroneopterin aldolase [Pseudomonadota bacterium]
MDLITLTDLEVYYRVGVPDAERAQPQRLLLTVEMEHDFTRAAASDDLRETIDYYAVSRRLLSFGEGRNWKLIEKLVSDIAAMVLADFGAQAVSVEVKKFIIPEARHVSVRLRRDRRAGFSPLQRDQN